MFCSTIIPTIGRETLARTVESVLNQNFPADRFEIIVVNDSGKPLREEIWQMSDQVKILSTNREERSIARNFGAEQAKGKFLHFLDDDDWLLPGALQAFYDLASRSSAYWLYGNTQLVDRTGRELIQLEHEIHGNCFTQVMAGEWIPLQSSLILAEVFSEVSGFSPLLSGPEDIDLCRRIALQANFDFTPSLVACVVMGEESSTTNYQESIYSARSSRETILDERGVFTRLRESAPRSDLSGRVARIYLTSAFWNVQNKLFMKALSRMGYAFIAIMSSVKFIFQRTFWQAIFTPYQSDTFVRGFQQAGKPVTSRKVRA